MIYPVLKVTAQSGGKAQNLEIAFHHEARKVVAAPSARLCHGITIRHADRKCFVARPSGVLHFRTLGTAKRH